MVCCSESRDPFGRHRPPWISLFFWSRKGLAMKRYHVLVLFLGALSLVPTVGMADVVVTEKFMVTAGGASSGGEFARALAANGQSVVAGLLSPDGMPNGSGAVDISEENAMGDGYTPVDTLFSSVPQANEGFGHSVGIDGTDGRLVVGVPFKDTPGGGVHAGSVVIYERDGSGAWSRYMELFNNPEEAGGRLGLSLSMDGDRFVAGSPGYSGGGRVQVFKRITNFCIPGTCWIPETVPMLQPPGSGANDGFGAGVDLAGACEKFVSSAPNRGLSGAAFVYAYNLLGNNTWDLDHILTSPDAVLSGQFGGAISGGVALTCDYVAVAQKNNRQVWVFSAGDYGIEAELSEPGLSLAYGESIDLSGKRLVVADPEHDTGRGSQGVVHYYLRIGPNNWERVATFAAPDGSGSNRFGSAVEIDGNMLFISAPGEDAVYYVNLDGLMPVSVPAIGPAGLAFLFALLAAAGSGVVMRSRSAPHILS